MEKQSLGRRSSTNPVRVSMLEREEKTVPRSDARRTQIPKPKSSLQMDNSQIPRSRIRSSSSERASMRRSNLKPMGKTPLRQTHNSIHPMRVSNVATPMNSASTPGVSSSRRIPELPTGPRHRSPSAERASGFGAKGPRKDNRPLADKSYQNFMLNKIDQYFYEIQQTSLLNPTGSLKPVTLKIFVEATNCLVKLLDVKQDLTIANYIEDIPKIAKKLHYLGTVTKSWLKTANTMHSWPQVLGWLSWLSERCEYREKADDAFRLTNDEFTPMKNNEDGHRKYVLGSLRMYSAWNDAKPEEEAAAMEKLLRGLNEEHGDVEKMMDEEKSLIEKESSSKEIVDKQRRDLEEELEKIRKTTNDMKTREIEEFETIETIENTVKGAEIEIMEMNTICHSLETGIEKDNVEHEAMLTDIEKQTMSAKKCGEIMKQCGEIKHYIHEFGDHMGSIQNELYAMDLKFSSCNHNLWKAILDYNKDIILHLNYDPQIDLKALKMPETNILSPDFLEELKLKAKTMLGVKEDMKIKLKHAEDSAKNNSDAVAALEERLKRLQQENADSIAKAEDHEMCLQKVQQHAKETETRLVDSLKQLESEIESLMNASKSDVEIASNDLAEANEKFQAVSRRYEFIDKRMEQFFDQFYEIFARHRKHLSNILQKLNRF